MFNWLNYTYFLFKCIKRPKAVKVTHSAQSLHKLQGAVNGVD